MVIGIAAHEHEDVLDPVGHAKAEDALVEIRDRLHVGHDEGTCPNLNGATPPTDWFGVRNFQSVISSIVVSLMSWKASDFDMPGISSLGYRS